MREHRGSLLLPVLFVSRRLGASDDVTDDVMWNVLWWRF
jgi:hypothetical protein